jgi:hypothetical protein
LDKKTFENTKKFLVKQLTTGVHYFTVKFAIISSLEHLDIKTFVPTTWYRTVLMRLEIEVFFYLKSNTKTEPGIGSGIKFCYEI